MASNTYSARSIALALGLGETQATLSIGQMNRAPRSSDPDSASTVTIIKGMQRGLNSLGCGLPVTGHIDPKTAACMTHLSGPLWRTKSWLDLGKDLVNAKDNGRKMSPRKAVGSYDGLGGADVVSSLGLLFSVVAIGFILANTSPKKR